MFARNKLAMLTAEFLGTGILMLVVLSVQRSQLGLAFFVALAAGLAVALLTYMFSRISGGHFNPALTLALWTARRIKTIPALTYIVAQLLGAWAAYGLYRYFVNTDVQAITQEFDGRILVAEAIGVAVFALAWAAAAYNRADPARFAVLSGVSFALAIIIASAASIGLANPALALGARAWEVFGENGWLNYVLGPVLGAILGVNLYGLLFDDISRPFKFSRPRSFGSRVSSRSSVTTVEPEDDDLEDDEVVTTPPKKDVDRTPSGSTITRSSKSSAKRVVAKKKR